MTALSGSGQARLSKGQARYPAFEEFARRESQMKGVTEDLSTQGFRVGYRKLYSQLVSKVPFPVP